MSVKILDDANYNTNLMERPTEMSQSQGNQVKLPSGVLNPKEWEKLQNFKNRRHAEELSKEELKSIILSNNIQHPYIRTMVPVDSNAFRWAVKIVTGQIVKAKNKKRGVFQFECCNLTWIGVKPRQCVHSINEKLRNQLDVRAQALSRYKPDFTPINLIQYMSVGGSDEKIDQKVVEYVLEDKDDHEDLVVTQDWTTGEDSDQETEENAEYLGYSRLTQQEKGLVE